MSNDDIWQCGCGETSLSLQRDGAVICEACGKVAAHAKVTFARSKAVAEDTHRQKHISLHASLDELLADFIQHTGEPPLQLPIMYLLQWSYGQTLHPTEKEAP